MPDFIDGHIYDYPQYYDLVFGSDWKTEFNFLRHCFEQHANRPVQRLFEPACGTGRLLIKFAQAGFDVSGNDLNPRAVQYCNNRFQRRGFSSAAVIGDMQDFQLPRKVDAAFNTINSFRHLMTEQAAEGHLRSVARCLSKGGLYILGLHLIPNEGNRVEEESWLARRGNLAVVSMMWSKGLNLRQRREYLGMTFDVYTLTHHFRILDEMVYRTYTARQMRRLLAKVPELEFAATYDFAYEIDDPITIGPETEDVVFVLRRR